MDPVRKQVEILNATTGAILATIPTVLQPTAIALNVATHVVFVACTGSAGSVIAIDGVGKQLLTKYTVPSGTTSISVNPVTNVVLLASQNTNTLTFIDVASGTITTNSGTTAANARATAYASGFFYAADTGDGDIFHEHDWLGIGRRLYDRSSGSVRHCGISPIGSVRVYRGKVTSR